MPPVRALHSRFAREFNDHTRWLNGYLYRKGHGVSMIFIVGNIPNAVMAWSPWKGRKEIYGILEKAMPLMHLLPWRAPFS
jgi:hypothetical protein